MSHEVDVAALNPEAYPLESAFQTFDRYAAMQNGEPQMMTFGESIGHYSWVNRSKEGAVLPRRKPMFIGSYENFGQMAVDLGAKAETDLELDPYKQMVARKLEEVFGRDSEPLPLTTSQEIELETFESSCLDLEEIREVAKERTKRQGVDSAPTLIIVNAETGESRTVVLDASALIADGSLELERKREKRADSNDVTIKTDIRLGKFLADTAAELGLDAANLAVVEPKRRKPSLYSARAIFDDSVRHPVFGYAHPVSNDIWTEDGEYSRADEDASTINKPPRHSLREALNFRRVDSYNAGDFLDAAQEVINTHCETTIHRLAGEKLVLQPLDPFDVSLDKLLGIMQGHKLGISELGYRAHSGRGGISPYFFRGFLATFRGSGNLDRSLSLPGQDPVRIKLQEAIREAERIQTPAIVRAGRFIGQSLRRS